MNYDVLNKLDNFVQDRCAEVLDLAHVYQEQFGTEDGLGLVNYLETLFDSATKVSQEEASYFTPLYLSMLYDTFIA